MIPRLTVALLPLVFLALATEGRAAGREVSFVTEDGWTIHGTLSLPDGASGKTPLVVLLPSAAHDRDAFHVYREPGQYQYPGLVPVILSRGVATLSLDLRGSGKSLREGEMGHGLHPHENAHLDVSGALAFARSLKEIDSDRIAIVAEERAAEYALLGWRGDSSVRAMAFISGRIGDEARSVLEKNPNLPLLLLSSSEDRESFADMSEAFFVSRSKETDLRVYHGLGVGTAMFSVHRYRHPEEQPLHERVGEWVAGHLRMTGTLEEVAYQTEDGWTIHANLRMPQTDREKVPAVILLHSGLSDRNAYAELEVELARAGLAVLNIDWRGKGKSTGKGKYFNLSRAERDVGHLDVLGGVKFLSGVNRVDASRIGVLGTVIGARYTMAALAEDPRIKTGVVLTGYIPTEKEREYLKRGTVPVLYVSSKGHTIVRKALQDIHERTKAGGSELVEYEGGAIGYQLFKLDKDLMPRVVTWMKDKLGG